jgi:hypothetical protein
MGDQTHSRAVSLKVVPAGGTRGAGAGVDDPFAGVEV